MTRDLETERRKLILDLDSSSLILKKIYELTTEKQPGLSLRSLAQSAGVSSKGYISEVIRGKKTLHPRYASALGQSLGLSRLEAKCLSLLVAKERCKNEGQKERLQSELDKARKALTISVDDIPEDFGKHPLLFDVFCAFGLFKGKPELEDLISYFGKRKQKLVETALDALLFHGLVKDFGFCFKIASNANLFFEGQSFKSASIKIIKGMLRDSLKMVDTWYPERDMSIFEANVVSTTADKYSEMVTKTRAFLAETKMELEASDATMLVRFNVQLYPSHLPASKGTLKP
ncbi:MAG: TIGR02147 family protein [Proteobacteria bacterium]|nr:TIGR02147 family protein [Pseudomonadota bacterium]